MPPNVDTSILDTISKDRGTNLLQEATKAYPYLKGKDIAYKYTPSKDERMLEFYRGEDIPEWGKGKQVAIEVFNPKTRPIDVLGDYVSHYGVQADPKLKELYSGFAGSLDPKMMQERYQYHVKNFGEKRPYDQWYQATGLPEMFRGYTFNQWGKDAARMYTPQQLDYLNQVRQYLGVK